MTLGFFAVTRDTQSKSSLLLLWGFVRYRCLNKDLETSRQSLTRSLSEVQKKIYKGHRMTKPDTSRDIKEILAQTLVQMDGRKIRGRQGDSTIA